MNLQGIAANLKLWDTEAGNEVMASTATKLPRIFCAADSTDKLEKSDYFFNMFEEGRVKKIEPAYVNAHKLELLHDLKEALPLHWKKEAVEAVLKSYAKSRVDFSDLQEFFCGIDIRGMEECYTKLQDAMNSNRLPQNIKDFFTLEDIDKIDFRDYRAEKLPLVEDDEFGVNLFGEDVSFADGPEVENTSELELQFSKELTSQKKRALALLSELWSKSGVYFEGKKEILMRNLIIDNVSINLSGVILSFILKILFPDVESLISAVNESTGPQSKLSLWDKIFARLEKGSLAYQEKDEKRIYYSYILNPVIKCFVDKALEILQGDSDDVLQCVQEFGPYIAGKSTANLPVDEVFCTLETWINEQNLHSQARFESLIIYYTSFINSIQNLSAGTKRILARFKCEDRPVRIQNIVKNIFTYSHLKIDKPKDKKSEAEYKTNCELITVYHQGHRADSIMGSEAKINQLTPAQKTKIIETFNLYVGMCGKAVEFDFNIIVKQLDRAHTLPFPVAFAWKWERVKAFITTELYGASTLSQEKAALLTNTNERPFDFSKQAFQEIKQSLNPRKIEELLSEAFNSHEAQAVNVEEFIFQSLKLVSSFYLRLFSETELMFDFINKKIDGLSEWEKPETSYKEELATALTKLLDSEQPVSQKDVVQALESYLQVTRETVSKYVERLDLAIQKAGSPHLYFLKACALQVEEGLLLAKKNAMNV